jgi:hypothetical protein
MEKAKIPERVSNVLAPMIHETEEWVYIKNIIIGMDTIEIVSEKESTRVNYQLVLDEYAYFLKKNAKEVNTSIMENVPLFISEFYKSIIILS